MVVLATAATVIASQASITGTASLTRQAIQLGYLPRFNIVQTSARAYGQIYIPALNWFLLVMVLAAVLGFGSSSNLAQAYGVALTGTMLVTTVLTFFVIRYAWRYPLLLCLVATGFFFIIDVAFFSSAMLKVPHGGWFPLAIGAGVFVDHDHLAARARGDVPAAERVGGAARAVPEVAVPATPPHRVDGTAIFLTATPDATPHALLHNLNHNKVLHERVVFLTVEIRDVPWVSFEERATVERLGHGCWRVRLRYGFMNRPDVMRALDVCGTYGLDFDLMQTSFFLSRQQVVPSSGGASTMCALARAHVRHHGAQRRQRHRLLRDSHQPGDRARNPGRNLVHQPVADPGFGQQVFRLHRVGLQLLPELLHVDAQVVRVARVRRPPHFGQQLAVRHHHAEVLRQAGEQAELDRREVDFVAVLARQALLEVDRGISELQSATAVCRSARRAVTRPARARAARRRRRAW